MTKLTLKANPTFDADVGIPVAGGDVATVRMTFRHRTKKQLAEFVTSRADKTDTQSVMDMVVAWDLSDPFNETTADELLDNYIGAALAIYQTYIEELTKAREKN